MKYSILLRLLILPALTLSFSAASENAEKKEKKKGNRVPFIAIQYSGGNKDFHSPKVMITPYAQFLEYQTKDKKKYTRDCTVINKNPAYWLCKSPCSGGDLKVFFKSGKGFDEFKVPAMKIQPSHCEQNMDPNSPWLTTKEDLVFTVEKLGTK